MSTGIHSIITDDMVNW